MDGYLRVIYVHIWPDLLPHIQSIFDVSSHHSEVRLVATRIQTRFNNSAREIFSAKSGSEDLNSSSRSIHLCLIF